jgi:ParB family chromosome partitioning protein
VGVSVGVRDDHASRLEQIDAEVARIVAALHGRGFKSPYLRGYVVARINPVRFQRAKKGEVAPAMPFGQALTRMAAAAKKFDLGSVSNADLALVAAMAAEPG